MNDILVKIGADISDFSRKMSESNNALKNFGKANQQTFDSFKKVGTAAVGIGTMIGVGLGKSVRTAADFEAAMSQVKAISGATGGEFDSLRDKAIEMGNSTMFSASESADAMANLAQMGWETDQIMGGIEHTLNLAAAGGLELADSAMIMANSMNQFGMDASEADRVADVFAYTAANAGTDVTQLGDAMQYAGANAAAAGMSIEDTSAFIGVLGDAGITGSKAGTSLNAMLRDLKKNSEDGAIAVGEQSVALYDAEGNMRNMPEVIGDIIRATETMSNEQRDAALSTLFGDQALVGFNAIASKGADSVSNLADELYNSGGAAKDMADTMMDNLNGALTELSSAFEGVQIALGTALIPAIRKLAEWLKSLADWFNSLSESTKQKIAIFLALSSVLLVVGGAIMLLIGFLPNIISGFTAVVTVVKSVGAVFASLSTPILAVVAVIGLVVAAIINLWRTNEDFRANVMTIWNNIKTLITTVWQAVQPGAKAFVAVLGVLVGVMSEVIAWVTSAVAAITSWVVSFIEANQWIIKVIEVIGTIIGVIAGLVTAFTVVAKVISVVIVVIKAIAAAFALVSLPVTALIALIVGGAIAIYNYWEPIKGFFINLWESIKEAGLRIWDNLKEGWSNAVENLKSAWEGVKVFFTVLWEFIKQISIAVWDGIKEAWTSSVEFLKDTWSTVKEFFVGIWEAIKESGLLIWENLKEGWANAVENLTSAWEGVKDFFTELWEAIKTIFTIVWEGIKEAWTSSVEFLKETWNSVVEFFVGLWESIKEVFANSGQGIIDILSNVYDWMNDLTGGAFGIYVDIIQSYLMTAWDIIKSVWSYIKDTFSNALDFIKALVKLDFQGMKDAMKNQMDTAKQLLQNIWNAIKSNIGSKLSEILSSVIDKFTQIKTNIQNKMNEAKSALVNKFTEMVSSTRQKAQEIVNAGREKFEAFKNAVRDKLTEAVSVVGQKVGEMPGKVMEFFGKMTDAGKQLIAGLINGIKQMGSKAVEAVTGVVDGVVSKAKSLLKIKSPSRVFMEIGQYTGEGLVRGMDASKKAVERATGRMTDAATPDIDMSYNTPGSVHRTMSSAINGSVDVNNRDEMLVNAINELRKDMTDLRVDMDGEKVGRIVRPHVNNGNAVDAVVRRYFD